jgi:hypothetical protein
MRFQGRWLYAASVAVIILDAVLLLTNSQSMVARTSVYAPLVYLALGPLGPLLLWIVEPRTAGLVLVLYVSGVVSCHSLLQKDQPLAKLRWVATLLIWLGTGVIIAGLVRGT